MPDPTLYVIGLAFNEAASQVVLIRKDHPAWQAGKWNGVGGKVEPGESITGAMAREFEEETGVFTESSDWQAFLTLEGPSYCATVCRLFNNTILSAYSRTSERVALFSVTSPTGLPLLTPYMVTPLEWLIPLAMDRHVAPGLRVWRNQPDAR